MRCTACGKENAEDARFCAGCGSPVLASAGRLVGQVVGGRYHVTREIGEGGMGVVYEAEQRLGTHVRAVALKTLHPELAGNPKQKSRFYRECGVVAQLDHPNVVRVLDFGETPDGTLYIAMELVRGRALSQATDAGPLPPVRVAHIVSQIAAALDEAHALGIVHRDLKPDNVLLTAKGNDPDAVKLLDFGIAKRAEDDASTRLTEAGVVLGTPPYMSPEQFAGEAIDRRSDVYALGVITYELLAGELPFVASNSVEWAQAHMTQPPRAFASFAPRVRVPPAVEAVVMRALAKTPAVRYGTAGELARELERAVTGAREGVAAPPPGGALGPVPAAHETAQPRTAPSPAVAPPPAAAVGASAPYGGGYPPAHATPAAPAYPVAIPRPAARESAGGGSRGLVVGLALLALLTAGAAAVVFVLQQRGSADPDPLPLPPLGPVPATVGPAGPTGEPPPTAAGTIAAPPTGQPASTKPRPPGTTPPATTTAPPATTTPPPATTTPPPASTTPPPATTTPPPATTSPPASGPTGDAACAAASASAAGGAIESAVSMYQRCQGTGGSPGALASAKARIAGAAPGAVRSRAFNGNCAGAKSAANAASSIGVSSGQRELERTSCR